jgi:hypothetical protein
VKRAGLAACAALALAVALFTLKASEKMPDFEVYWHAGVRAAAAQPLYRIEDGHYQFKYLPAFAVLAIPIGLVPLQPAKALWLAVSVALLAVLVASSLALLPERRRPAWLLAAVTVAAMAKFYGHELVLGQANILLGTTVVVAVHRLQRGRDVTAGLLVALAVIIKPYAVIALPWLACRRRIGAVAAAAGGGAAALVLPAALYGVQGNAALHREWWRTVTGSTAPNLLNADNVSLPAMYAKWLGAGSPAAWLAAATAIVLVAFAAVVCVRSRDVPRPDGLEAALLLTLIPLLSPQGWDYVFLLSTPAIVFLVNYADRLPGALRIAAIAAMAAIGASIYDVMGRAAYAAFMRWSVISVCYLIVVAALCALRFRRVA